MGKDSNGIPDRWLPYSPMGSIIPGTRFIACKVPLKEALLRKLPEKERFGPKNLLEAFPKIGLLVDLTNTTRYYLKQDFTDKNIQYEKIFCPGKVIPPNSIIKQFFNVVDDYLATEKDPDAVIVVHCTHGVNRTGYFICRYMIEKLQISPEEAIKNFHLGRGHGIERDIYVSDLRNGCKGGKESDLRFVPNFGRGRRDGRREMPNFKRGFRGADVSRNGEIPGKRYREDHNRTLNDHSRDRSFGERKKRHPYFNEFGDQEKPEDKYAYNWRDLGNIQNPPFPTTTPLPQFTPNHQIYQGPPMPPYQTQEPYHQGPPSRGYSKRGHCGGPSPKLFGEPSHKKFSPFPKFSNTVTPNEIGPSSRNLGNSVPNSEDAHYGPIGGQSSSRGFRGNFRGRVFNRGGGNGRGRGFFNRGGSSSWRAPQRNSDAR